MDAFVLSIAGVSFGAVGIALGVCAVVTEVRRSRNEESIRLAIHQAQIDYLTAHIVTLTDQAEIHRKALNRLGEQTGLWERSPAKLYLLRPADGPATQPGALDAEVTHG